MHLYYPLIAAAPISSLLMWGGIIGAVAVAGGIVIMAIRAHLLAKDTAGPAPGFTLEELRKLRDRGELTAAEYEVAKNRMSHMARKSSPKKGDGA